MITKFIQLKKPDKSLHNGFNNLGTEEALSDIDNIATYISKDSVFYARQFVQKLFAAAVKLERYPEIGKPLHELPDSVYKEILFKRYRIIYRFDDTHVYIISVHHSARLLKNNDHFKDDLS